MNEQIIINMGMDARPVSRGLRSISREVSHWAVGMKHSVKEALSGLIAPLTGAGLVVGLERIADRVKSLRSESEAIGVSTKFLQDIQHVGEAAGVAGDKVQSMLNKFVKSLPAGADVEREFYRVADELSKIADPAERARRAIDYFGRSGVEMVKVIGQGSEAVKELADQFGRLGETDMKAIEEAHHDIEKLESRLTIVTAKIIGMIALLGRAAGRKSVTGESWGEVGAALGREDRATSAHDQKVREAAAASSAEAARRQKIAEYAEKLADFNRQNAPLEERAAQLERDRAFLAGYVADKKNDEVERGKAALALAQVELDRKKANAELDKKRTDDQKKLNDAKERELEMQFSLGQMLAQQQGMVSQLNTARGDRTHFTLQDLASIRTDRNTTWDMRGQIFQARQVMGMENRARNLAAHGYGKEADELMGQADKIRGGLSALTSQEREPFAAMEKSLDKVDKNIDELVRKATAGGIKIIPISGE